ncbi:MAG: flagellar motor switch phosphatase FliY [Oscillospiraceae bacterium]|jgi:flagellar motor switch protein FliN/FliY|nr:flagellar motor switch phosphatase FliY [Oscillospiraceae bacterium]
MASVEFSDMQKDAIAEVMNISMGNAATAASELLNAKVWITTPKVSVKRAKELHNEALEPAVCVKIVYVKGITGTNLMVLRQDDVQLILNQLMGQPLVVSPDFEFDELNISAVSEVMNQMMGSSATALSNFLGFHIDISTPTPYIMEEINLSDIQDYDPDDEVVSIDFDITIEGVIKSEFVSVMSIELAQAISEKMLGTAMGPEPEPEKPAAPTPAQPQAQAPAQAASAPQMLGAADTAVGRMPANPPQGMAPQGAPMPQYDPMQMQMGMPQMQMGMGMPQMQMGMQQQMPYGAYPPLSPYGYGYMPPPVNIQNAQLHQFEEPTANLSGEQKENLQLLMGVPLQISVEIGKAKRKVKEILEFTQGTVIELERQAGAPVDIVVNGNLIAQGDVVVVDDNFAVRITEIVKSKFIDSLGKE